MRGNHEDPMMDPGEHAGSCPVGPERYHFDTVVVDAGAHTLTRDGEPVAVEPKAFAVLLELLRHPGELLGRDELLDRIWGHRHVTPGVLTRVIAQLRGALGDDAHLPRYIQTQHALGYRFVGKLEPEPEPVPAATAAAPGDVVDPVAMLLGAPPLRPPEPAGPDPPAPAALPMAVPVPAGMAGRRWRPRHAWMALAAVLGLALVATFWWARGPMEATPGEASVAVLPFTTLGEARGDDYFAEGLAIEMHDALSGVPGLRVAAPASTAAAQRANPDPRALGATIGVATVLDANVRRDGDRVRINTRLVDTGSGFTLWSEGFDRELDDVFDVQAEIAAEVTRALLGVLPRGGDELRERLAPTRQLAAYEAYLKGRQQLSQAQDEKGWQAAIRHFRQALVIDRGFSRARAGVCRVELKRFEAYRDTPAFERARDACEEAERADPELREVSLALGDMYRVRGEDARAIEEYTRALDDLALRPEAWIGLARIHSGRGEDALAQEYFDRALALHPGDAAVHRELGMHRYASGDVDGAIASFLTATSLLPDDAGLWASLGGLYLASGDRGRAVAAFNRSLSIQPGYAALSNLGTLRYGEGDYAAAASLYRQAALLDPGDFRIWGNLGDAASAAGGNGTGDAAEAYGRAAGMAGEYLAVKPGDAQATALLGWYQANLGRGDAARAQVTAAEALATEHAEVALINAQTLALLGDATAAHERLRRAREAGIADQRIAASPVLRRLPDPPAQARPDRAGRL